MKRYVEIDVFGIGIWDGVIWRKLSIESWPTKIHFCSYNTDVEISWKNPNAKSLIPEAHQTEDVPREGIK